MNVIFFGSNKANSAVKLYKSNDKVFLKIKEGAENLKIKAGRKDLVDFATEVEITNCKADTIHRVMYQNYFAGLFTTVKDPWTLNALFSTWGLNMDVPSFPVRYFLYNDTLYINSAIPLDIDEGIETIENFTALKVPIENQADDTLDDFRFGVQYVNIKNFRECLKSYDTEAYAAYLLAENKLFREYVLWLKSRSMLPVYLMQDLMAAAIRNGDSSKLPTESIENYLTDADIAKLLKTRTAIVTEFGRNIDIDYYESKLGVEYYD